MSQDLRDLETMQGKDSTDYECKKQAHLKESEALHRQIAMIEREQEQAELAIEDVKSKLEQLEHAQEVRETDVLDKQPPFKYAAFLFSLPLPPSSTLSHVYQGVSRFVSQYLVHKVELRLSDSVRNNLSSRGCHPV